MVELDLSFVSLLALAFAVGSVGGYLVRGLRRRRVEDMLQFFRQRDQEQDRRIANLEREVSDARGRLLSMKADQVKTEKATGELRAAFDEAQRTIARLREELATRPPAPPAPPPVEADGNIDEDITGAELPSAPVALPVAPPAAAERAPAESRSGATAAHRGPDGGKKSAKKGRLP